MKVKLNEVQFNPEAINIVLFRDDDNFDFVEIFHKSYHVRVGVPKDITLGKIKTIIEPMEMHSVFDASKIYEMLNRG